jgi:hypothetical protein
MSGSVGSEYRDHNYVDYVEYRFNVADTLGT